MKAKTIALVLGGLFAALFAAGQNITITNNSFEGFPHLALNSPGGGGTANSTFGAWKVSATGTMLGQSSTEAGPTNQLGSRVGTDGTNIAMISLPLVSLAASVSMSQLLSQAFNTNTTYTLSVSLDQGVLNLLGQSSLNLLAGTNIVASLSGTALSQQVGNTPGFVTVNLVYATTNGLPTGNIGVSLIAGGIATVGDIFADNFQLTATPIPEPQNLFVLTGVGFLVLRFWQRGKGLVSK